MGNKFADELLILRRLLRDPDGEIWSDADIVTFYNDTQEEIFSKVGFEERVHTYSYPPKWVWSYFFEWEFQHIDGDRYKCMNIWQARNMIVCYPWEPGYFLSNSETPDSGYRFIHPWESEYGTPADYVPNPLHEQFHSMKFAAYDKEPLTPIDRKQVMLFDRFYRTNVGQPEYYWRPDTVTNQFVLYKRPSSVTWDDDALITRSPLDTYEDTGGIKNWESGEIDEQDAGIILDTIDTGNLSTDGHVLMIFEIMPTEITYDPGDWSSLNMDIPEFFIKYVRYGTLERCFGANTDGFIPSLRDYWALRKTIAIKMIKKFKSLRMSNREYRMGGELRRYPDRPRLRLPSDYPITYP